MSMLSDPLNPGSDFTVILNPLTEIAVTFGATSSDSFNCPCLAAVAEFALLAVVLIE